MKHRGATVPALSHISVALPIRHPGPFALFPSLLSPCASRRCRNRGASWGCCCGCHPAPRKRDPVPPALRETLICSFPLVSPGVFSYFLLPNALPLGGFCPSSSRFFPNRIISQIHNLLPALVSPSLVMQLSLTVVNYSLSSLSGWQLRASSTAHVGFFFHDCRYSHGNIGAAQPCVPNPCPDSWMWFHWCQEEAET